MTNARPKVLSLAVAFAISSSIIATEALAGRRLQIKPVDIQDNEHAEFIQSEVEVRPTLGLDQQPIPKSFTTTYTPQVEFREGHICPSKSSFVGLCFYFDRGVSIVDQFETGENDVAQKYTKVLKVGDEGVFRFTHSLDAEELLIEVRAGMTDEDSVNSVRAGLSGGQPLEPSTKLASTEELYSMLLCADDRAGSLGSGDHYVALATIKVKQVAVNGRTFMRLISGGAQPPGLKRLGQSLFVNDGALLTAATSAYIQVHVLGGDIQQRALNELLEHNKPVGYVVHADDDTLVYPVPSGYPKLEVTQTAEDIIIFRGHNPNPADVAFVENLLNLKEAEAHNSANPVSVLVLKSNVKRYLRFIRSRQLALLEEFVARHNAGVNEDQTTLAREDKETALALAKYESLQQALSIAEQDETFRFAFTADHIRAASSLITPIWMQAQLLKRFSFNPVLRDLLTSQHAVENILNHISTVVKLETDGIHDDEQFAVKFKDNMARQLAERDSDLQELLQKEAVELLQLEYRLQRAPEIADTGDEIKLEVQQLLQIIKGKVAKLLVQLEDQQSLQNTIIQKIGRIPELEQEVLFARSLYNAELAVALGKDDWSDTRSLDEHARRLLEKINGMHRAAASAGQPQEEPEKTTLNTQATKEATFVKLRQDALAEVPDPELNEDSKLQDRQALNVLESVEKLLKIKVNEGDDMTARLERVRTRLVRQMARPGSQPGYVPDSEVVKGDIEEAESALEELHRKLDAVHGKQVLFAHSTDVRPDTVRDTTALNQAMKQIQTGLGLTQDDNQTPEDLIDGIKRFLKRNRDETDRRVETFKKLGAAIKDLRPPFESDPDKMSEEDYMNAVRNYVAAYGRDEVDFAIGELPETRRKYTQVTKYLHEHEFREMELAHAQFREKQAQEALNRKNQDINHSKDIDPQTKTSLEDERAELDLVLEQKKTLKSEAQKALEDHKASLKAIEETVGVKPDSTANYDDRVNALRNKKLELGGNDGNGGRIQQLIQEQDRLESEIEAREADIERMKEVLRAAGKAVKNDGGPFRYTPGQVKVLAEMHDFIKQHSLKKQALEAATGLAASALNSGKVIPCLTTFDFDDEFAPIRLQALVGKDLTFNQASRIVGVFKSLKRSFPLSPSEPDIMEQVESLAHRVRSEIGSGAQQYDEVINGMGETAIHFVEHESGDLTDFSEYFATHSASGNKIIALLREGLISKIELENYMKAAKDVGGYLTAAEFEHFLGNKHGINVLRFKAVVQMLSDAGVDEFIQSAFTPVAVTAIEPAGMKESVAGMKEYSAAIIANYILDDIAFENGRRTAAFLTNVQDTLTPYANAAGLSESDLIKAINSTLMQAHAAAVEHQLNEYWLKPSAFLVQAVTWYFSSYAPLLATHTTWQATELSFLNMSFLYLLDLTNRGDYLHRMLTPFQHWLERFGVDLDRTDEYADRSGIEQVTEVSGLAMPMGRAASSVILLRTGSMLFARQYNANPYMYHSIFRLAPEIVKSMGSGQGLQVPLLHRATPQKVKTLASATAGLVLGPVATVGAYAHGLISGFTYAQTFGFALASSLTFDFFMNDNKMLTQWLGGPLGRSLDRINRWLGLGENRDKYVKRTAIASPQRFNETDEAYAKRVKAGKKMYGWTRHENYLQFRDRRDRTMKLFENGWEKYFRDNVPKWSFSHAESIPYSYTLGNFNDWQKSDDQINNPQTKSTTIPTAEKAALAGLEVKKSDLEDKNTYDEL
ncbi:hypothetical protein [Endozoicomonas sp. 2B-B]